MNTAPRTQTSDPKGAYVAGFISGLAGEPADRPARCDHSPLAWAAGWKDGLECARAGIDPGLAVLAGWADFSAKEAIRLRVEARRN